MRKLLFPLSISALALAVAIPAMMQPGRSQNQTCPTASFGTNDNQCASTAFVQGAAGFLESEKASISSLSSVAFSGAGADVITNAITWTPVLTFATPGNLAVAYTTQFGRYYLLSTNLVLVQFNIVTSSFTFTTATGNMQVTGLPLTATATSGLLPRGAMTFGGINKAGYSTISTNLANGSSTFQFNASGMGVVPAVVTAADTPTGGAVALTVETIIFL